MVILKSDRNYCFDCVFLLGIRSTLPRSDYQMTVKSIDAGSSYSHLLKIGEVKMIKFPEKNQQQIFQFMVEQKDPISIIPSVITGKVKLYLSFDEDEHKAFAVSYG